MPPSPASTLLVLFWPFSLASAAARIAPWFAVALGTTAATLIVGLTYVGPMISMGEPFWSIPDYMYEVVTFGLFFAAIFFWLPGMAVAFFAYWLTPAKAWSPPRRRVRLCAILLAPCPFIIPAAIWACFAALPAVRHPSFGMATGKPAWINSLLVDVMASPAWFILMAGACIANTIHALRQLRDWPLTDDPDMCPNCAYPRRGLPLTSPCPECGSPPQQPNTPNP